MANKLEWLIRGVVGVVFATGIAGIVYEVGYVVGTIPPAITKPIVVGGTENTLEVDSIPENALLPPESAVPSLMKISPTPTKEAVKRSNAKKHPKYVYTGRSKDQLSPNEYRSLMKVTPRKN